MSEKLKELKILLVMIAVFLAAYLLPFTSTRFLNGLHEAFFMLQEYARLHVLLCLVPALFIAGAVSVFISKESVMRFLGAKAKKWLAYSVAAVSGAILAGDTLYSKAFQVLGMTKARPDLLLGAMNMLSRTCTAICEGQWLDMEFESKERVSEAEYLEMIEKKTGVLYGASAAIGALLAGAKPEEVAALDEFGRLTGMGFQLQDDVIDLVTPEDVSGKRQGGDLIEAKKTLIMIHAFAHDVPVKVFGKKDATPEQIQESISLLEKSGSIEYARSRAEEMVARGKLALQVLPDSKAKATLLELADYMVRRQY